MFTTQKLAFIFLLFALTFYTVNASPTPQISIAGSNFSANTIKVHVTADSNKNSSHLLQIQLNGSVVASTQGSVWYNFTAKCGPKYALQGFDTKLGTYSGTITLYIESCTSGSIYYPTLSPLNFANGSIEVAALAPAQSNTDTVELLVSGEVAATGSGSATVMKGCGTSYSYQAFDVNQDTYSSAEILNSSACPTSSSTITSTQTTSISSAQTTLSTTTAALTTQPTSTKTQITTQVTTVTTSINLTVSKLTTIPVSTINTSISTVTPSTTVPSSVTIPSTTTEIASANTTSSSNIIQSIWNAVVSFFSKIFKGL